MQEYKVVGVFHDGSIVEITEDCAELADVTLDIVNSAPGLKEAYIVPPDHVNTHTIH